MSGIVKIGMNSSVSSHIFRRKLVKLTFLILFFCTYFIAGKLGLRLAFFNQSATAVWPPTGIAFALLLFLGYWAWPAIFVGAFLVNLTTAGTILTSLGIALGNTLEAVIAVYCIKKFSRGLHTFDSISDIFKFTFFAAILSTAVSATIGVSTLLLGGLANVNTILPTCITWWMGDMGGD